jgi:hypothetical protein
MFICACCRHKMRHRKEARDVSRSANEENGKRGIPRLTSDCAFTRETFHEGNIYECSTRFAHSLARYWLFL